MSKMSIDLNNIQIIYEGVLKKSPPIKSKSLFSMIAKFSCATDKEKTTSIVFQKRWRKRYFVLFKNIDKPHDIHFLYFKSKPSADSRSLGSINMENFGSLAVDVGKKVNKSNVFSIQTLDDKDNSRVYYLSANSFELMQIWVEKIINCLDLNNDINKTRNNTPILHSPINQSVRGIPRSIQIRPSISAVHTTPSRTLKSPVESSKLPANTRNNENSLTYYNMDRYQINSTSERLEDPISTEDEDTYKFPCEINNEHSYFNLGDLSATPVPKTSNSFNQVFFGSDQNFPDLNTNQKSAIRNVKTEQKDFTSNEYVIKDLSQYQAGNLINLDSTDINHDFNFELPKRIKNDDSSSTSSCYSSTNTNSSSKDFDCPNELLSFKELKRNDPPQLPKRLNVSETPVLLPPRASTTILTLPSKPPRILKPDPHDPRISNSIDEVSTTLNYLDATNLLLENKPILNSGFTSSSVVPDPFNPVHSDSPKLSPDIKNFSDINSGLELIGSHPFDSVSSNLSAMVQNSKEVSLIEYSEINDARTEGLHKLNERILKNE